MINAPMIRLFYSQALAIKEKYLNGTWNKKNTYNGHSFTFLLTSSRCQDKIKALLLRMTKSTI